MLVLQLFWSRFWTSSFCLVFFCNQLYYFVQRWKVHLRSNFMCVNILYCELAWIEPDILHFDKVNINLHHVKMTQSLFGNCRQSWHNDHESFQCLLSINHDIFIYIWYLPNYRDKQTNGLRTTYTTTSEPPSDSLGWYALSTGRVWCDFSVGVENANGVI